MVKLTQNLTNCNFCYSCKDCEYCFACSNLQNKKFYFFNENCFTKDEYEKKVSAFRAKLKNNGEILKYFLDWKAKFPHHNSNIFFSENCSGYNIQNSNNCIKCFHIHSAQNLKFCSNCSEQSNSIDVDFDDHSELSYENMGIEHIYNSAFTFIVSESNNIHYSNLIFNNASNLFGCISIKNKSYCILNKQYTKEEYETLVPKIIEHMIKTGEWGEFFSSSISPFGYNETVAQEYFPLSKEEAINKGFNWSDYEAPFPKADKTISKENMSRLPDNIKEIPEDILNWALTCEVSGRPYKIIKQELDFYKKHNIPIPRRHPDQRHLDRMKLRNPRKLYDRTCMKCNKSIQTTYNPQRPEIVYCEKCYNKEVY